MTSPGAHKRPAGCPSNLALDELMAGDLQGRPGESGLRAHVDGCAPCQRRIAARAADPVLVPDRQVLGPLLDAQLGRARARRRRVTAMSTLAAVAAAVVMVWALRGRAPDGEDGRTKGGLALTVHVKRASGAVEPVNGEGQLAPGDEMRFSLALDRAGYAAVLGLDAAPSVAVYLPAGAPIRVAPPGPVVLPGSVVADRTAGVERVFALVCEGARPPETLRQQAQAALARAGGRPEVVSSLESGCLETSVLLRKGPP